MLHIVIFLALAVSGAVDVPEKSYFIYACAESDDTVALIEFGPEGAEVAKEIAVGSFPAEIEGPHGINVSPDGRHWYLSLAHGLPYGSVQKYSTGSDEWQGDVTLGLFPATLDVSASTGLMYVVNFNLHGKMEPSTISVVETDTMLEVARIPTGIMPHGSRLSEDGRRHYSVAMMDDVLVEVDALRFEVARVLELSKHAHDPRRPRESEGMVQPVVQPTWVTPPTPQGFVYVAGNKSNEIFEVDLRDWRVTRRFETIRGPYNLAATPDGGTLTATYKKNDAVGIWDLNSGRETARIETLRPIPHGIVVSPDGRYAFATIEGRGGEPGSVEVYRIGSGKRVASVEMGKQAGGIAFWKSEP